MTNIKIIALFVSFIIFASSLSANNIALIEKANNAKLKYVNNIPVVDIASVNSNGQSINYFSSLDVDPQGLVFNNSAVDVYSKLAGLLQGNHNLIIGNEAILIAAIVSGKYSSLSGIMEIAGKKADFILINPNAIYLNEGIGFINTNNVILSTGNAVIDQGVLSRIDILKDNEITIGMQDNIDLTSVNNITFIGKKIEFAAGSLKAKDVSFILGQQTYDIKNKVTTSTGGLSINSVYSDNGFEGINANNIYFNLLDNLWDGTYLKFKINANFDINILSGDKIYLKNVLIAGGSIDIDTNISDFDMNNGFIHGNNVAISSKSINIDINSSIYAKDFVIIDSPNYHNNGIVNAGINVIIIK